MGEARRRKLNGLPPKLDKSKFILRGEKTMAKKCSNCAAWERIIQPGDVETPIGVCYRHPPQIAVLPQRNPKIDGKKILTGGPIQEEMTIVPTSQFPATHQDKWCLDHVPKAGI